MIVRRLGRVARQLLKTTRHVAPIIRIYTRTFISSRHKYTEGYIQVVKKNIQHTTPVAFRYVRGSELVQRLTALAFDMISDHITLQEWYARQWESLCSAIVSIIESEYESIITSSQNSLVTQPISIDSYIIEDKIGDISTCAAVYRALRDEEPVALKAMFNFYHEDEDDMMRLENFGAELFPSKMDKLPPHHNVIRINAHFISTNVPHSFSAAEEYPAVFEWGQETTLYIEMPLYSSSLKQYLTTVRLSEPTTLWVFYQIVSAVHHIHSHGIVHRDIKSDNILLRLEDGALNVVLTDFGMAHDSLRTKSHPAGRKWGNPMLMPPEIAKSKSGALDYSRSDMWCVGSLVYELLGTHNPFSTLPSGNYNHQQLPPLPSDNQALSLLVSRLLSPDPLERPSPSECLVACGALLWLPHLLQTGSTASLEDVARELTLLSWNTFRAGQSSRDSELIGLMYFLRLASASELWKVINSIVL